jgi:phosphate transport system permease protein
MSKAQERKQIIQDAIMRTNTRRKLLDRIVTYVALGCVALALVPLGSILFEVAKNGAPALSLTFLMEEPGRLFVPDDTPEDKKRELLGGIGPAIQGTLIVVGLASLIGIPAGVLGGIYLSEYAGAKSKFAYSVRFFNSVMTGLPSIVLGIVGYIVIVLTVGSFSVMAGALALSIIMIPIVLGVTEETLKLVPNSVREAGHSLGIPKWKVTMFITLKSAMNGVLTGIVLGISRIAGETAPLIMTILGTSLFFQGLFAPTAGLPLSIWRLSQQPYPTSHEFAWGAAFILILMILSLSVALRYLVLEKKVRLRLPSRSR